MKIEHILSKQIAKKLIMAHIKAPQQKVSEECFYFF